MDLKLLDSMIRDAEEALAHHQLMGAKLSKNLNNLLQLKATHHSKGDIKPKQTLKMALSIEQETSIEAVFMKNFNRSLKKAS